MTTGQFYRLVFKPQCQQTNQFNKVNELFLSNRNEYQLMNAAQTTRLNSITVFAHLRSHPADGWNIITSTDEVPSILLQLELTQPLIDGLCILQQTPSTNTPSIFNS